MLKMNRTCTIVLFFLLLPAAAFCKTGSNYDAIDPYIGTSGGGNTFPGASLPFGMIQWSPDTAVNGFYKYNRDKIYGFSLTHISGAGCPIYGDFPFLPLGDDSAGELITSPATDRDSFTASFDHANEEAHPGYYAVTLAGGINVALTVTSRAGIARIRFPHGKSARLIINSGGSADTNVHHPLYPPVGREHDGNEIEVIGNDTVNGSVTSGGFCGTDSRYTLYFAAKFQQPVQHFATWNEGVIQKDQRAAKGKHTGAWLDFGADHEQIQMKVGLSYVSAKNALDNLNKEIPSWDFDSVHATARQTWTTMLDRLSAEGGTSIQRKIFYTGLYHMLLSPTLFSDSNSEYIGFDEKIHSLSGTRQKAQYANFSDWDIYRNPIQLQAMLMPGRVSDMMQSLVNDAEQSGWLPNWEAANDVAYVMGGDSPTAVLASAYAFGARNFDTVTAYEYMLKAATQPGIGPHNGEERPFLADYLKLGYVPLDKVGIAASVTLEYASDDFAIAQFAKATGHMDAYREILAHSGNWRNLFDPETKMIRPRNSDGTWLQDFDPDKPKRSGPGRAEKAGFQEGNTWHYTFMIPFDYPRLVQSMGGNDAVTPRLDRFFAKIDCRGEPCYTVGNEPDFVAPFAYLYVGKPWKAQEVLTRIEQEAFDATPSGLPGNDDLGATSGVYVWNALGMYPGVPGLGGVFLGTPMFRSVTLHIADGAKTLVIRAEGDGPYVDNLLLNGKIYANGWLPLSALGSKITELTFHLSPQPNLTRGEPLAQRPPSFLGSAEEAAP